MGRRVIAAFVCIVSLTKFVGPANAVPHTLQAPQRGVGVVGVFEPLGEVTSAADLRRLPRTEPTCRRVRTLRGIKDDCSLRDMYRLVSNGDSSDIQAAALALINDRPRQLKTKNKYDLIDEIPRMSGACVSEVRGTLLSALSRRQLVSKNLDSALSLAKSWDVVWGAIGSTRAGADFMVRLSEQGLRSASKRLAADYTAGKLQSVLQLNPTAAFSDAVRVLSRSAADIVDRDTAYWVLMEVYSHQNGSCYQIK